MRITIASVAVVAALLLIPCGVVCTWAEGQCATPQPIDVAPPGTVRVGSQFGQSIALHDDVLIVGSPRDGMGDARGRGYVYERTDTGWQHTQTLAPSALSNEWDFGLAVAAAENIVVVSAGGGPPGVNITGAVYVFERAGVGQPFLLVQELRSTRPFNSNVQFVSFGRSLAVDDGLLLIGEAARHMDSSLISGAGAEIYTRTGTVDQPWVFQSRLSGDDTRARNFGFSMAMSDQWLVVGANGQGSITSSMKGEVWIFPRAGNTFGEPAPLPAPPSSALMFGSALALRGNELIVSAPQGASATIAPAYVFAHGGATDPAWRLSTSLRVDMPCLSETAGWSIALGDRVAAIVTSQSPCERTSIGRVNTFVRVGEFWQPQRVLPIACSNCGRDDVSSVLIDGDAVLMATRGDLSLPSTQWAGSLQRLETPTCDCIDANRDGVYPDDGDVLAFLRRWGGQACGTGPCVDIDFNNDGLFPDEADLVAFLRVLAGGTCEG